MLLEKSTPSEMLKVEDRKEPMVLLGLHSSPLSIMASRSLGDDRIALHHCVSSSERASMLVGRHQFIRFST